MNVLVCEREVEEVMSYFHKYFVFYYYIETQLVLLHL